MKTPKWTKADDKRAEKMGWILCHRGTRVPWAKIPVQPMTIHALGDRFKSDDEAIAWVNEKKMSEADKTLSMDGFTCRKALHLCAKG